MFLKADRFVSRLAMSYLTSRLGLPRLVDLPGRRRFLRNAVAGLAQADGAVLLVPADEMPLS